MRRIPWRARPGRPMRALQRGALLLAALGLALAAAGCSGSVRPVSLRRLHWIIGQDNLSRLEAAAPGLADELLAGPQTIVVRTPSGGPVPVRGEPMDLFTSYADFTRQLQQRAIPPSVRTVAYDPESWPGTPAQEQRDPLRYLALFARTARDHGYRPVLAPGRDLTLSHRTGSARGCGASGSARPTSGAVFPAPPPMRRSS